MGQAPRSPVTELLEDLRASPSGASEGAAWDRLLDLLYAELHRIAKGLMAREARAVTLEPTALVHEAFLRLVDTPLEEFAGRAHFLRAAARCMRHILVDAARARATDKRGGGRRPVTWNDALVGQVTGVEVMELHQALQKLADLDVRAAQVAEMRLFGGMTVKETSEALQVSARTVDGDWAMARLWLSRELRAG